MPFLVFQLGGTERGDIVNSASLHFRGDAFACNAGSCGLLPLQSFEKGLESPFLEWFMAFVDCWILFLFANFYLFYYHLFLASFYPQVFSMKKRPPPNLRIPRGRSLPAHGGPWIRGGGAASFTCAPNLFNTSPMLLHSPDTNTSRACAGTGWGWNWDGGCRLLRA